MGGLGHMGVQFAAAMGAETIVLGRTLAKREDGLKLGPPTTCRRRTRTP
nr:hypothetical protein [Tessaracoccus coleopterorum]